MQKFLDWFSQNLVDSGTRAIKEPISFWC